MSIKTRVVAAAQALFGPTPAPITVKIEIQAPSAARKVFLGTTELVIGADGKAEHSVSPGVHYLFWTVFGGDGQTYEIKITAPEKAKWEPGPFTIRGDHDTAAHEFTI